MPARSRFLQNVFGLYGLYFAGYLLALVSVPYLARVLGADGWGLLSMVQSFTGCLLVCIDFGFALTATGDLSRAKGDARAIASVLGNVLAARLVLTLICVVVAAAVQAVVPAFRDHPGLFWSGMFWAVAQGNSLLWYYQAVERADRLALTDIIVKSAAVVLIFIFVDSLSNAWLVLTLHGIAALGTLAIGLRMAYSSLPLHAPTFSGTRDTLFRAAVLFVPRNAWILFAASNAFVLGLFAPPLVVGWYAGAERLNRAVLGLLVPVTDALNARASRLRRDTSDEMGNVGRRGIFALSGFATVAAIGLAVSAPAIAPVLLGSGFGPAIAVLQILSMLMPLIALTNVLGINVLLPLGRDRTYAIIVVSAGLLNVILAAVWAKPFGERGAAYAAVTAHFLLAAAACFLAFKLTRSRGNPGPSGNSCESIGITSAP